MKNPTFTRSSGNCIDFNYTLDDDLTYQTFLPPPSDKPFRSPLLNIEFVYVELDTGMKAMATITVAKGYTWDGPTVVPDYDGTILPACLHDSGYEHVEDMAAAWGVKPRVILEWFDEIFQEDMIGSKAKVSTIYFLGVRLIGYPFHEFNRWVMKHMGFSL